jgi:hypothetical protein
MKTRYNPTLYNYEINHRLKEHIQNIRDQVHNKNRTPYFVTTAFPNSDNTIEHRMRYIQNSYNRFYRHLISYLDRNYCRHKNRLPITLDFIDFPNSRKSNAYPNDPKTPHYHSIYLIDSEHVSKFEDLVLNRKRFHHDVKFDKSETLVRSIIDCHVEPLLDTSVSNLHNLLRYASKFIRPSDASIERLIREYASPDDLRASIRRAYEKRLKTLNDDSIPSESSFPHTTTNPRHSRKHLLPPEIRENNRLIADRPHLELPETNEILDVYDRTIRDMKEVIRMKKTNKIRRISNV